MNNPIEQAEALYQIVPAVYRTRDTGDLKRYFKACGLLLDQILATLQQRLADNFADNPLDGSPASQDWILPYFADLLDVRLVSPLVKGRRDEVAHAVRWRQGKGTLWVIEEIAEAIGQLEIVLQEGWKRVAATARLNTPRIPATSFGYDQEVPLTPPAMAARHPGLPAATVDFRCPSGATAADSSNPAAQQSTVDGDTHIWRQTSYHGAPCYPGSYEDVSRRTVDFRDPDWRVGHYHPDRILLYTVPPLGLFDPNAPRVNWSETPSAAFLDVIDVIENNTTTIYRNKTYGTEDFVPVSVRRTIKLGQVADGVGDPDFHTWRFEGLILENLLQLDSGRAELYDCAARKVEVHSIDVDKPVITARDCLIRDVQAARGLSRLEYCTVLRATLSEVLWASDSIFLGRIRKDHPTPAAPDSGCVRYSRIDRDQDQGGLRFIANTRLAPVMFSSRFGDRGCGVLHPATPAVIRHGAEDGGEMGAYHRDYLSLLAEAVVDKLRDYLPVGLQAVVIPDTRLLDMPG
jgi:hypothetical protein